MHLLKDIYGSTLSALLTIVLFLGPLIMGTLSAMFPTDMVELLIIEERPTVYFDAAFHLASVEIAGDLDGTSDSETPVQPKPNEDGDGGSPDANTTPESSTNTPGADILADTRRADSARGVNSGAKRGNGVATKGSGAKGRKRKRSRKRCPKTYEGVVLRDDGVYELNRDLVHYYTGSMKRFNSLGWSKSNDEGKGWIISGFDCRSPMWHGGMRRGDIVLSVNGKKTNNMFQLLRLYPSLRRKRFIDVNVLRKGRSIILHYEIVRG